MSQWAVMPYEDYSAACAATRSKTGKTANITSGQLAAEINSIETGGGGSEDTIQTSPTMHTWSNGSPFLVGDTIVYRTTTDRESLFASAHEEVMDTLSSTRMGLLQLWVGRPNINGTHANYTMSLTGSKFTVCATGSLNNSSAATGKLRIGYNYTSWRAAMSQAPSAYGYITGGAITPVFVGFYDMFDGSYASANAFTIGTQLSYTVGYAANGGVYTMPWAFVAWYGADDDIAVTNDLGTNPNKYVANGVVPEFTGDDYNKTDTFTVPEVKMQLNWAEYANTTRQLAYTYYGNSLDPDTPAWNCGVYMASYAL